MSFKKVDAYKESSESSVRFSGKVKNSRLLFEWLNSGIYLLKAYDAAGKIWYSSFAKID
ncbi:MAG: hypothetical protein IPK08_02425 [Bacteroidetes bacterium]|nr:hypothetical protein [Bacteroidota bacterium]